MQTSKSTDTRSSRETRSIVNDKLKLDIMGHTIRGCAMMVGGISQEKDV